MRVLVCGGRDFGDLTVCRGDRKHPLWAGREKQAVFVRRTLDKFCVENSTCYHPTDNWLPSDIVIIHGGAKGADSCADEWAVINWCKFEEYKADWERDGRAAGFIRNSTMLREGKPDVVIAFPGGRGTAMMVKLAKKSGVKVIEVLYEGT